MKQKLENLALGVFGWFVTLVVPPPKMHSAVDQELTPWEIYFLKKSYMRCPDCEHGILRGPPRRPNCSNSPWSRCSICEAEFTISFNMFGEGRLSGMRLKDGTVSSRARGRRYAG